MMNTTAPFNVRAALLHLQLAAKAQLADYELHLVRASSIHEAAACRAAIRRLRAAIFASELDTYKLHKGSVQ